MHRHLVEFLAGLLLMVEGSETRINNRLKAIGFCISEVPYLVLPIGPFVFMGVVMFLGILGVVAIVTPTSGTLPLPLIAFLIGATKTIGVLAAVLPKLRWRGFRPNSQGDLPYFGWLTSAVVAALISVVIERAAVGFEYQSVSAALDFTAYPLTPLAPATFAISLSIAILCDVNLGISHVYTLRITEGLLCGAAMTTCIFICLHILSMPSATEGRAFSWFPFAFSFSLGFLAGVIAPELYRRHLSRGASLDQTPSARVQVVVRPATS
jgi:hypothetical protein